MYLGEAQLQVPPLPAELQDANADALNSFAWDRVECGRSLHLQEREAMAAAQRAVRLVEEGDTGVEELALGARHAGVGADGMRVGGPGCGHEPAGTGNSESGEQG